MAMVSRVIYVLCALCVLPSCTNTPHCCGVYHTVTRRNVIDGVKTITAMFRWTLALVFLHTKTVKEKSIHWSYIHVYSHETRLFSLQRHWKSAVYSKSVQVDLADVIGMSPVMRSRSLIHADIPGSREHFQPPTLMSNCLHYSIYDQWIFPLMIQHINKGS